MFECSEEGFESLWEGEEFLTFEGVLNDSSNGFGSR